MPFELILFTRPEHGTGTIRPDGGGTYPSHTAVHQESGRVGIGFTLPDNTAQANGAELTLTPPPANPPRSPITQRGRLYLNRPGFPYPWTVGQQAALDLDDFAFPEIPVAPTPPPNTQDPARVPLDIILAVERTGQFDLTTTEGCGRFTEACCTQLHTLHSVNWGHVRKVGQQNQYNGHAVDAIMLKEPTLNTPAAIYDIIVNSEAPGAHAAMNFSSAVNLTLWYYPA
jgi:hypothetical protein